MSSGSDNGETIEDLEQQVKNHDQEEDVAAALEQIAEEMGEEPPQRDAYQEREIDRQDKFNALFGDDEVDAEEAEEYLQGHHANEVADSDGKGDT